MSYDIRLNFDSKEFILLVNVGFDRLTREEDRENMVGRVLIPESFRLRF